MLRITCASNSPLAAIDLDGFDFIHRTILHFRVPTIRYRLPARVALLSRSFGLFVGGVARFLEVFLFVLGANGVNLHRDGTRCDDKAGMGNHAVVGAEAVGVEFPFAMQELADFELDPIAHALKLGEHFTDLNGGGNERAKITAGLDGGVRLREVEPRFADIEEEGVGVAFVKTGANVADAKFDIGFEPACAIFLRAFS